MIKNKGLGRGLDALLGGGLASSKTDAAPSELRELAITI